MERYHGAVACMCGGALTTAALAELISVPYSAVFAIIGAVAGLWLGWPDTSRRKDEGRDDDSNRG